MTDKVLDIILNHNKALSYDEIASKLSEDEIKELTNVLNKLEKTLKIRLTKKGKYEKFNDKSVKIGVFAGNKKGFGFVDIDAKKDTADIVIIEFTKR